MTRASTTAWAIPGSPDTAYRVASTERRPAPRRGSDSVSIEIHPGRPIRLSHAVGPNGRPQRFDLRLGQRHSQGLAVVAHPDPGALDAQHRAGGFQHDHLAGRHLRHPRGQQTQRPEHRLGEDRRTDRVESARPAECDPQVLLVRPDIARAQDHEFTQGARGQGDRQRQGDRGVGGQTGRAERGHPAVDGLGQLVDHPMPRPPAPFGDPALHVAAEVVEHVRQIRHLGRLGPTRDSHLDRAHVGHLILHGPPRALRREPEIIGAAALSEREHRPQGLLEGVDKGREIGGNGRRERHTPI